MDIDPQDIDPETGRPYPGYSSPSLDNSFHETEMRVDDDDFGDGALGKAKRHLAQMMMNQVGAEWDECCESARLFAKRQGKISDDELIGRLYSEAYRYEDM
jgi:hypothetical protein